MNEIKKMLNNLKFLLFLILILFAIINSLKNGMIETSKFFLSNIAIRQGFFEENNVDYKGTHEPGKRYMNLLYENYDDLKNLKLSKIFNKINKIKIIDIKTTEYELEYELINKLKYLSNLSSKEKKNIAIYLPQNLSTFWNLSCDKLMLPFLVPSITNIVMINGLPPSNIKSCYGHRREYGLARYRKLNKKFIPGVLDSSQICNIAQKEGIEKVIEIYRLDKKFDHIIHKCNK